MDKIPTTITLLPNTKTKLKILAKQSGLSIGQVIDLMTQKQKSTTLLR